MNNLSNTAKKLDKILEIAYIVLGAMAIGFIVCVALIAKYSSLAGMQPKSFSLTASLLCQMINFMISSTMPTHESL